MTDRKPNLWQRLSHQYRLYKLIGTFQAHSMLMSELAVSYERERDEALEQLAAAKLKIQQLTTELKGVGVRQQLEISQLALRNARDSLLGVLDTLKQRSLHKIADHQSISNILIGLDNAVNSELIKNLDSDQYANKRVHELEGKLMDYKRTNALMVSSLEGTTAALSSIAPVWEKLEAWDAGNCTNAELLEALDKARISLTEEAKKAVKVALDVH